MSDRPSSTLLIVDDDPGIRSSFTDYLEDRNYRVLTADNGSSGLQAFQREKPDLVLLDLRMPVMSGLELLGHIQSVTSEIPLIVVSGTGRISDAVEALHLGAWDYLLKPVEDLSMLGHIVEKSLERASLLKQNREYQEHLERLVRERTVELEETNQRLQHLNARLQRVVKSTSTLSSSLDIEQFGRLLLEEFARNMGATGGSLYLQEKHGLRLIHAIDPGHAPQHIPFPLPEHSVLYRLLKHNKPLLLQGMKELKNLQGSGWRGYSDGSALIFPMQYKPGGITAILTLHNKKQPPFVEQDKEIGTILASYSCESLRAIRTFAALRESEERYRELADMLPQTVCETDQNGIVIYANQQAFQTFGYTERDLDKGLSLYDFISQDERSTMAENAMKVLRDGVMRTHGTEYNAVRKDGSRFPVLVYSAPIMQGSKPAGMRVVAVDITLRKQQEEMILRQAHYDSLTGLPNRFLVLDRLDQYIKDAQRSDRMVAILFLDLDDFKKVNDTLGHDIGDRLLIQASKRLRDAVRDVDTIGRLGGDEFIVVLGGLLNTSDAQPVAENLLNKFRAAFELDNRELVLTASLGIAIYPQDGKAPTELLRKADTAMYHAKAQGRNAYHYFTSAMNQAVSRRLALEQHLNGALNRGEFQVHFQPLIKISSGAISGFEALLRWRNPTLGDVSPGEFIPIAEQTGLIIPIGQFVLTQALAALGRWQQRYGKPFKVAVNLSPRQFRDPELPQLIDRALRETDVTHPSLELEITEGVLMIGHAYIHEALVSLSRLGVGIAMDDFGTGYSSLNYLRTYPFDTLKIDRSFVQDISNSPRDRELVSATIAMAHGLGLKVIAEGVETEEQLAFLSRQNCDLAQGFLFSRPNSVEVITELLEKEPWYETE